MASGGRCAEGVIRFASKRDGGVAVVDADAAEAAGDMAASVSDDDDDDEGLGDGPAAIGGYMTVSRSS